MLYGKMTVTIGVPGCYRIARSAETLSLPCFTSTADDRFCRLPAAGREELRYPRRDQTRYHCHSHSRQHEKQIPPGLTMRTSDLIAVCGRRADPRYRGRRNLALRHPVEPDASAFPQWRASLADEQWVAWGRDDGCRVDSVRGTFGLNNSL